MACISLLAPPVSAAPPPDHSITAANIDVTVNSFDNDTNAVTLTIPNRIGDFRAIYGNNGDYDVQVGTDRIDDVLGGILITSVRQNGRDNSHPIYQGMQLATSHIDYHRPGSTNAAGEPIDNSYWIPITTTQPNSVGTQIREWDINIAAAWFPYDKWLAGFARNTNSTGGGDNGGAHNFFTGSPSLVLGTHYVDLAGGNATVDLTGLGIDSRTDGVLLVMGAKNEDNYGLSQVDSANGTWKLFSKDNGTDGASTEKDPFAFVFIPKTDTSVISGRFLGNGTIAMHSGDTVPFTITQADVGTWELKIPGKLPRFGVLILSPEGGLPGNQDNTVTYQVNDAGDGWIIQSWDLPSTANPDPLADPPFFAPPLETPGDGTEPVASFVFIPGATPGITVTPTQNLYTTESGGTADFTVVLDTPPTSDVTIDISSDNPAEGTVSLSSLTFTPENWDVPQNVIVTGQDDGAEDGPITYHVVLAAASSADVDFNGLDPVNPTVINLDNESPITIVPISGLVTTEAGGTATFDVVLNAAPTGDVVIGLSSSDTTEGTVSTSSLTFTPVNWNQVRTVTVTGVDDSVQDGDIAYTIVTAAAVSTDANFNGAGTPDVAVMNHDNDNVGINVSAAGLGFSVVEGQANTYTVVLTSQPTNDVSVDVTSSDTVQGGLVSPATLTFTSGNWNTPQIVLVAGADDLVVDGDSSWDITNSFSSSDVLYGAIAPIIVSAATLDNEPTLTLSEEVFYGAETPAVGIDGRAVISDPNTDNYDGVTIEVELTAGGTADDRIEIRNTGTGSGEIGVSGSNVTYGGTTIGSFAGGVGLTPLVVTFNSAATATSAEALLRNVTFRNVNSDPSFTTRILEVTLTHADNGQATATTSVRVGPFRVADFQEGADHGYGVYLGQADIELFENLADVAFPAGHSGSASDPRMWIDARSENTTEEAQVLMRFDNIIGTEPGQIPLGAKIVSAELLLTVIDTGHGSPLFRMLRPWNEESDTWFSFNFVGIQINDVDARSTFDSQFGVQSVAGTTQTGQITVGVTADVQAWADGEANYGWGMTSWDQDLNPSWNRGNNGLALRPSEAPITEERPRLRVLWVPAETPVASFRQDVDSYTSAHDTRIREDAPDEEGSALATLFIDFSGAHDVPLLRFDDIIGTGPGQVPPGSHINAAILDLASLGGNAPGDGGQFFAMLSSWQVTDTWNTLVNGISTDGIEAAANPTVVAGTPDRAPNVCGGYMSFEVTADVQAWANGTLANNGWAILPWDEGSDGWSIGASESGAERARPRLRVFFTPGTGTVPITLLPLTVTDTSVTVRFSSQPDTTFSVRRSATIDGTFTVLGTATTGQDGTATFVDNAPLPNTAFYRVSNP